MKISSSCALAGVAALSACLGVRLAPQDPVAKTPAEERYEAVLDMWSIPESLLQDRFKADDPRVGWSRRLAEAAVECGALPAQDAFGQHLARMAKELEDCRILFEAARRSMFDVAAARYHVAEAKLLLARLPRQ